MFDGCLVINLAHRTDRWKFFQEQIPLLTSLGLNVERINAVYGRQLPGFGQKPWFTKRLSEKRANAWAGKAGCTLSHRRAIERAKELGWKNVLILEDDCHFESGVASQWDQLHLVMKSLPEDWIAIYLYGHHTVAPIRVVATYADTSCFELCGASSTVAYLLNAKYFDVLLSSMPKNETIWQWTARYKTVDRWFSRTFCCLGRVYAMSPFGNSHLKTPSDTTTAGDAYIAPGFDLLNRAQARWFSVSRLFRCMRNRLALIFSIIRLWGKCLKGL